eukprot:NODE_329_length_1893_cov_91.979935_g275_i1.p1 GENE.NODE_329_length_1893_cov_91.979935_g275_i1~~NODE_329_length_1893_cov_91.979935_g275_i1.p1  ORF type:complete len:391 (-),score=89.94 NODE_329_length_1893_cov_91.979935_g275_i1:447-1619(-)
MPECSDTLGSEWWKEAFPKIVFEKGYFSATKCHFGAITEIDVSKKGITEVPHSVTLMTNLRTLRMQGNRVTLLPEFLGNRMPKLKTLEASDNRIDHVHHSILDSNIEKLSLKGNPVYSRLSLAGLNLTKAPRLMRRDLPQLTHLNLSHNRFSSIEAMDTLGLLQLQVLDISHNRVTELPESLSRLRLLQRLNASHNRLTSRGLLSSALPLLEGVVSLKMIDISHNLLTQLTPVLNRFPEVSRVGGNPLQSINWAFSRIRVVREDILEQLSCVTTVDFYGNQLTSIPNKIWDWSCITHLDIGFNHIPSIPDDIMRLQNLKLLNLGWNPMPIINPKLAELKNLERLAMMNLTMTEVPKWIGMLPKVFELYLDENYLTSLPKELGNVTTLKEL